MAISVLQHLPSFIQNFEAPWMFAKYQALGNTYVVMPEMLDEVLWQNKQRLAQFTQVLCHPSYGFAADGVLWWKRLANTEKSPSATATACHLRIFNPDGSEAEKSGNGLRIFAHYLYDHQQLPLTFEKYLLKIKLVKEWLDIDLLLPAFTKDPKLQVSVHMGQASFTPKDIPLARHEEAFIQKSLTFCVGLHLYNLQITALSLGNPHCVVFSQEKEEADFKQWACALEKHQLFPHRTNVQWAEILDPQTVRVLVWERGVGLTQASGSSACAVVAAAHRLGLLKPNKIEVQMPGGNLQVILKEDGTLFLSGPVRCVAVGIWQPPLLLQPSHT